MFTFFHVLQDVFTMKMYTNGLIFIHISYDDRVFRRIILRWYIMGPIREENNKTV